MGSGTRLKDSGTFSKCPQIYIKLTGFEDNDSGKLPFKYYLLRCCTFSEMSPTESHKGFGYFFKMSTVIYIKGFGHSFKDVHRFTLKDSGTFLKCPQIYIEGFGYFF